MFSLLFQLFSVGNEKSNKKTVMASPSMQICPITDLTIDRCKDLFGDLTLQQLSKTEMSPMSGLILYHSVYKYILVLWTNE